MSPQIFNSITHVPTDCEGSAVLAASHAGAFVAQIVLDLGLAGVVLSDAGIGRDRAGVLGLALLDRHGTPAAAIDAASARIGDGGDCLARGTISTVNEAGSRLGVHPGMPAADALAIMARRPSGTIRGRPAATTETRRDFYIGDSRSVVLIDSASMVRAEDGDAIVVTGSHGALLGSEPSTALKYPVRAAVFNDAGGGCELAGASRLPALNERGTPTTTVSAWSARIGFARSTYNDGFITHLNDCARALGAEVGRSCREFVSLVAGLPVGPLTTTGD